jgi:hypothetical protein
VTTSLTVECDVHFGRNGRAGRKRLEQGPAAAPLEPGRVARVARLMALALHFEKLLHAGAVRDYAELARLGRVTRARVSQVMNLLLLAPDLQERLLFLPKTTRGRDPLKLADLQPVCLTADWAEQRRMWPHARTAT